MIERVFHNVKKNLLLSEVVVATCNKEIFDHISLAGGKAIMTSKNIKEHLIDVMKHYLKLKKIKQKYQIIVMVQEMSQW